MALHAVENVEEAFGVTREFLTPVGVRRWLKLALVVFFVGSGVSFPTAQFNTSTPSGDVPTGEFPVSLPVDAVTLVVALVGAGLLLGGLFALIGAIMEFVLIESLRTGDVAGGRGSACSGSGSQLASRCSRCSPAGSHCSSFRS
jgi:hypothetical protein